MEATTATPLDTITTKDQNTGRQITWNVGHAAEIDPAKSYGWTHTIMVSRPKGRAVYVMHAELIGDVIVRHSNPRKMA